MVISILSAWIIIPFNNNLPQLTFICSKSINNSIIETLEEVLKYVQN